MGWIVGKNRLMSSFYFALQLLRSHPKALDFASETLAKLDLSSDPATNSHRSFLPPPLPFWQTMNGSDDCDRGQLEGRIHGSQSAMIHSMGAPPPEARCLEPRYRTHDEISWPIVSSCIPSITWACPSTILPDHANFCT